MTKNITTAAIEVVVTDVSNLPALMDGDAVKAAQDGIRTTLTSLDQSIHANAVQCLMHAHKYGDTSLFRRLLLDVITDATGYRRQGLIVWMREFSPLELSGKVINLSGVDPTTEQRKPFRIAEAHETPFWTLSKAKETVAEPIFRDGLLRVLNKAVKTYKDAVNNTVLTPGVGAQPIDPSKPFYDGVQTEQVEAIFDQIATLAKALDAFPDGTKDVWEARKRLMRAEAIANAA